MKRLLPFTPILALIIFLASCASAKQYYTQGQYDKAISLAAKKLRKKPDDQKTIDILANSWEIANKIDKDELNRLMGSSNVDWEKVFATYKRLDNRQRVVMQLPPLKPTNPQTNVDFKFENYSGMLDNSKQNAINDLVNKGDNLMATNDRFNIRQAYDYYNKAYSYDNSNGGIRDKANQALEMGMSHILVQIGSQNNINLPIEFINKSLDKNWTGLQTTWTKYHNVGQGNFVYHYFADMVVNSVILTPEKITETSYTDTKKIEDGWEYAKNPDGSVQTDSLGNKIKIPVYRDISCKVTKYTLSKDVTISGNAIIYSSQATNPYANDAISSKYSFNYEYGKAQGDERALSTTSQNLIKKQAIPFPSDNEMVISASTNFGNLIYNKVKQYKSYFK